MSHVKACQAEGQEARAGAEKAEGHFTLIQQRTDGERGIFRLVKRFNSLHWVITP